MEKPWVSGEDFPFLPWHPHCAPQAEALHLRWRDLLQGGRSGATGHCLTGGDECLHMAACRFSGGGINLEELIFQCTNITYIYILILYNHIIIHIYIYTLNYIHQTSTKLKQVPQEFRHHDTKSCCKSSCRSSRQHATSDYSDGIQSGLQRTICNRSIFARVTCFWLHTKRNPTNNMKKHWFLDILISAKGTLQQRSTVEIPSKQLSTRIQLTPLMKCEPPHKLGWSSSPLAVPSLHHLQTC